MAMVIVCKLLIYYSADEGPEIAWLAIVGAMCMHVPVSVGYRASMRKSSAHSGASCGCSTYMHIYISACMQIDVLSYMRDLLR